MTTRLALPKGRLQNDTASLLAKAALGLESYYPGSRNYRLASSLSSDLVAKVFQEKDIPVQVAVGNYDLGICGQDWKEELVVKYPASPLVKVRDFSYGGGYLYLAVSQTSPIGSVEELVALSSPLRIASEYPNLAESLALKLRLKRFQIFPLWGRAEVYPPEGAELVLVWAGSTGELTSCNLRPLLRLLAANACIVASRRSWEGKDLSSVLEPLLRLGEGVRETEPQQLAVKRAGSRKSALSFPQKRGVRLALPDGHQQAPTARFLKKAGLSIPGYDEGKSALQPTLDYDGISLKVVRPQDMPLQVANGNFDLAITGRDWLSDHLYRFPSSPVQELLDLKYGAVKIVAVVSQELPINTLEELRQLLGSRRLPVLRVASEYVNIADRYAQSNHLSPYRIIPTWGASEAFLPEDADLLIENVETGGTLARHNLRVLDTLFPSSACLIGRKDGVVEKVTLLLERIRRALDKE